jgi:hypothetical protein
MLAKQVLSQLSYTPKAKAILILKHFLPFRNPILRIFVITVPKLYQNPRLRGPAAPRREAHEKLNRLANEMSVAFHRQLHL